jgi:hypothetical protein
MVMVVGSNNGVVRLAARLACVALVVSVVFPVGRLVFPLVADELGSLPFSAVEAMFSATVGFSLYATFFG